VCVDFLQGTASALIRSTAPPTSTVASQSERYEHDPVLLRNVEISFQDLRIVTPKARFSKRGEKRSFFSDIISGITEKFSTDSTEVHAVSNLIFFLISYFTDQ